MSAADDATAGSNAAAAATVVGFKKRSIGAKQRQGISSTKTPAHGQEDRDDGDDGAVPTPSSAS